MRFVNELGNTISIEVLESDIEEMPGILISIQGPKSVVENHITRQEAEILSELLAKTLKQ